MKFCVGDELRERERERENQGFDQKKFVDKNARIS